MVNVRAVVVMLLPLALLSCALGADPNGDDDDTPVDSRVDTPLAIDAPRPIDAPLPIDAPPPIDAPLPIDAPGGGDGGLFCNSTSECSSMPGTCCFYLVQPPGFCVPGQEVMGVCLPN